MIALVTLFNTTDIFPVVFVSIGLTVIGIVTLDIPFSTKNSLTISKTSLLQLIFKTESSKRESVNVILMNGTMIEFIPNTVNEATTNVNITYTGSHYEPVRNTN